MAQWEGQMGLRTEPPNWPTPCALQAALACAGCLRGSGMRRQELPLEFGTEGPFLPKRQDQAAAKQSTQHLVVLPNLLLRSHQERVKSVFGAKSLPRETKWGRCADSVGSSSGPLGGEAQVTPTGAGWGSSVWGAQRKAWPHAMPHYCLLNAGAAW